MSKLLLFLFFLASRSPVEAEGAIPSLPFSDSFSNGVLADSDTVSDAWSLVNVGSVVSESGGSLNFDLPASNFRYISTGFESLLDFYAQQLTVAADEVSFAASGSAQNLLMIQVGSEEGTLANIDDAIRLKFRGDGLVVLTLKKDSGAETVVYSSGTWSGALTNFALTLSGSEYRIDWASGSGLQSASGVLDLTESEWGADGAAVAIQMQATAGAAANTSGSIGSVSVRPMVSNAGFESVDSGAFPMDWEEDCGSATAYSLTTTTAVSSEGSRSLQIDYWGKMLEANKRAKVVQNLPLGEKKRYLFEFDYSGGYLGKVMTGIEGNTRRIAEPGFCDDGWKTLRFEWEITDSSAMAEDGTTPFVISARTFTTNLYIDNVRVTPVVRDHEQSTLDAAKSIVEAETNALWQSINTIKGRLADYQAANDADKPWFYLRSLSEILERSYEWIQDDYDRDELWYMNRCLEELDECHQLEEIAYDLIDGIDDGDPAVVAANKTYVYDGGPLAVQGRVFRTNMKFHKGWVADRDMMCAGLLGFGSVLTDDLDFICPDALGANTIALNMAPKQTCSGETNGVIQIDAAALQDNLLTPMDDAASNNIMVTVNIGGALPVWFEEAYGDEVLLFDNGFYSYDVNHPDVRRLFETAVKTVVSAVTNKAALHSVMISNEPRLEVMDITASTNLHAAWQEYLEDRFANVVAYNTFTDSSYGSFAQVPASVDGDLADPSMLAANAVYDDFIRDYFATFNTWLADLVKSVDPSIPVHSKITLHNRLNADEVFAGNDLTDWAAFSDLLGYDMNYYPNTVTVDPVWASSGALQNAMLLDLYSSLKYAPLFNSEAHIIPNQYSSEMQENHVYTAMWHAAMHGQAGMVMWLWSRWYDGMNPNLKGLIGHHPRQLYGMMKATHDLNRLIYTVERFLYAEKEVALVYSRSSMRGNPGYYSRRVEEAYEALSANGYNVGFITEEQMENNQFGTFKAVVCAGITHLSQAALVNLRDWEAQTSTINVIRYGGDIFKYDELGAAHDGSDKPNSLGIGYTLPTESRINLFRNDLQPVDGLYKNAYVKEQVDGSWSWPLDGTLEWRLTEEGSSKFLSVINLSQSTKVIHVERLSGGTLTELISQEELGPYNQAVTIPPMTPCLLVIE